MDFAANRAPSRTLIVTTSYPTHAHDAAGHFVRADARAIVRVANAGTAVTVLTPASSDAAAGTRTSDDGIREVRIAAGDAFGWPGFAARAREKPSRVTGAALWIRGARAYVRDAAARREVDHVIAHWAVPNGWIAMAAKDASIEIVSHGGDVRALLAMPSWIRSTVVSKMAKRAGAWRFVAQHLLDALSDAVDRDTARAIERIAEVRPCALEIPCERELREKSRGLRASIGARHADRVVSVIGRLVPSKRVHAALSHAAEKHRDAHVVVVGDGPERATLESHARALGVRATFVGNAPRDVALAWMCASETLVFASKAEGAPSVVREARELGVNVDLVP